jgi:hypothetical protein
VFHINLLTPYCETIMHGPNYQHPLPDLVDGEEEYSVEKILDSRKFSRRQCLQYLVKWEGYPESDNMWVDKDDVFADDKVREFKASNPAKEVHIRSLASAKSPYLSTLTHSHLLLQHAVRYMSSNGSDVAHKYPAGAYADSAAGNNQPIIDNIRETIARVSNERTATMLWAIATPFKPQPQSPSAASIADAFRQLSLADASDTIIDNNPNHVLMLRVPEALIIRNEDSSPVA